MNTDDLIALFVAACLASGASPEEALRDAAHALKLVEDWLNGG